MAAIAKLTATTTATTNIRWIILNSHFGTHFTLMISG
jgi:hypothetical protein